MRAASIGWRTRARGQRCHPQTDGFLPGDPAGAAGRSADRGRLLGRLPFAINALAVLLYAREVTGSFAGAGLVSGGSPSAAHSAPRFRAGWSTAGGESMLLVLAGVHGARTAQHLGAGRRGRRRTAALMASGLRRAASPSRRPAPYFARAGRSLLGDRTDLVPAAYALDSILIEVAFIAGPLLTAGGHRPRGPRGHAGESRPPSTSPGRDAVRRLPAARARLVPRRTARSGHARRAADARASGRWRSPSVPVGFCLGTIEVGLPAFSALARRPRAGGRAARDLVGRERGRAASSTAPGRGDGPLVRSAHPARLPAAARGLPLLAADDAADDGATRRACAGIPLAPLIASSNEIVSRIARAAP